MNPALRRAQRAAAKGSPERSGDGAEPIDRCGNVRIRSRASIPIADGIRAEFVCFEGPAHDADHFAILFGGDRRETEPLVRVHSECITGDLFGSLRCDCGQQLKHSIAALDAAGGVLLYLRQEGRGIGLGAKLATYALQERGLDTFAANAALGHPADARDYQVAAHMLMALGLRRIRLITNNPDKVARLSRAGVDIVERISTPTFLTAFNRNYLATKASRAGHCLSL